jgi:hypothetical protein
METIDRINLIWDIIDRGLTAEERRQILMIIPATPEEEIGDFLALAAEPGGQSGQFAPQRRRVARQQPQRNT